MARELDLSTLPGFRFEAGQSSLRGPLQQLFAALDALFVRLSRAVRAEEAVFPALLPASALARLDYLRSFPHLATFACTLRDDPDNLRAFIHGSPADAAGEVRLSELDPVTAVLTPAACYHVYVTLAGSRLASAQHVTTRCACFRRESHYLALRRQWCFNMREIVCVGTAPQVKAFLRAYEERLLELLRRLDWPVELEAATDPFFDASKNPKFLLQQLEPVKHELVFDGSLALGSLNFHRNFFGDVFDIQLDGEPVFSGCVAFGIERWLYAFLSRHGASPERWPDLRAFDEGLTEPWS